MTDYMMEVDHLWTDAGNAPPPQEERTRSIKVVIFTRDYIDGDEPSAVKLCHEIETFIESRKQRGFSLRSVTPAFDQRHGGIHEVMVVMER